MIFCFNELVKLTVSFCVLTSSLSNTMLSMVSFTSSLLRSHRNHCHDKDQCSTIVGMDHCQDGNLVKIETPVRMEMSMR